MPIIREAARRSDRAEADDVANETCARLLHLHARGRFDPGTLEDGDRYLRVVVKNLVRERRRAARPTCELAFDEPDTAPNIDDVIDARRGVRALHATLRPRDASALALMARGDDVDEIAHSLAITRNNVYQITHRIRSAAQSITGSSRTSRTDSSPARTRSPVAR